MKIAKEYSGNKFTAKQKAKQVSIQITSDLDNDFCITFWNKEPREIRSGVKHTDVFLSKDELIKIKSQIDDAIMHEREMEKRLAET